MNTKAFSGSQKTTISKATKYLAKNPQLDGYNCRASHHHKASRKINREIYKGRTIKDLPEMRRANQASRHRLQIL